MGALAYWPPLFLGFLVSSAIAGALYSRRSVHAAALFVPGVVIGVLLLVAFLRLDYRSEQAELTTRSGIRGAIYEDSSGEFGVHFIFSVQRADGSLVGESYLDFAMEANERRYILREVEESIQVFERLDPEQVIAW